MCIRQGEAFELRMSSAFAANVLDALLLTSLDHVACLMLGNSSEGAGKWTVTMTSLIDSPFPSFNPLSSLSRNSSIAVGWCLCASNMGNVIAINHLDSSSPPT